MSFNLSYYRDNDCSTHLQDLQFADTQIIEALNKIIVFLEGILPKQRFLNSLIDKSSFASAHRHVCVWDKIIL